MIDEGELCTVCHDGYLEFAPPENCSCHIAPPCGDCTDNDRLHCPTCWTVWSEFWEKEERRMSEDLKMEAAALLVLTDVTTVKVKFDERKEAASYTFKVHRDVADQLGEGDFVLCESTQSKRGFTLGHFVSTDAEADVSLDGDIEYKWVVGRVENPKILLEKMKLAEKGVVDTLKATRRARMRTQVLDGLNLDPTMSVALIGDSGVIEEDKT